MRVEDRLMCGKVLELGGREAGFLGRVGQDIQGVLVDLLAMFSSQST